MSISRFTLALPIVLAMLVLTGCGQSRPPIGEATTYTNTPHDTPSSTQTLLTLPALSTRSIAESTYEIWQSPTSSLGTEPTFFLKKQNHQEINPLPFSPRTLIGKQGNIYYYFKATRQEFSNFTEIGEIRALELDTETDTLFRNLPPSYSFTQYIDEEYRPYGQAHIHNCQLIAQAFVGDTFIRLHQKRLPILEETIPLPNCLRK